MSRIREARPEDAPRLLEIYGYYIENTAVTYEYTVPSEAEFRARIEKTLTRYPYLVAEEDGAVRFVRSGEVTEVESMQELRQLLGSAMDTGKEGKEA